MKKISIITTAVLSTVLIASCGLGLKTSKAEFEQKITSGLTKTSYNKIKASGYIVTNVGNYRTKIDINVSATILEDGSFKDQEGINEIEKSTLTQAKTYTVNHVFNLFSGFSTTEYYVESNKYAIKTVAQNGTTNTLNATYKFNSDGLITYLNEKESDGSTTIMGEINFNWTIE